MAAQAGFVPGDELLAVGDRPTPTWEAAVFALMAEVLDGEDLPVRVRAEDGLESVRLLPRERALLRFRTTRRSSRTWA